MDLAAKVAAKSGKAVLSMTLKDISKIWVVGQNFNIAIPGNEDSTKESKTWASFLKRYSHIAGPDGRDSLGIVF